MTDWSDTGKLNASDVWAMLAGLVFCGVVLLVGVALVGYRLRGWL